MSASKLMDFESLCFFWPSSVLRMLSGTACSVSIRSWRTLLGINVLTRCGFEGQVIGFSPSDELNFHAFLNSSFLQGKMQKYRTFQYK